MRILNTKSRGVTLVELSIVLAILGILVVATISGKSLIDISRATATIQQFADRTLASQIFSSTYDCIPGDCITSVNAVGATGVGNGNGSIEGASATLANEVAFFEEHLVKAALFNRAIGTITAGIAQGTSANLLTTILPKTKITNGYISSITISNNTYNVLGGLTGTDNIINHINLNSSAPMKAIDVKLDDGVGTTGDVVYYAGVTAAVTAAPTTVPSTTQAYTVATGILYSKSAI